MLLRKNCQSKQWYIIWSSNEQFTVTTVDKKLSRCWDSTTCELFDAEIIAAKVQNLCVCHWFSEINISQGDHVAIYMRCGQTFIDKCVGDWILIG